VPPGVGIGGWGTKAGFELARRALRSGVEDRTIDVLELSPESVGVFDLVLFLGVLYHMRHPLLALERVASVTGGQLILETHVDLIRCGRPAMAFYAGNELDRDHSNWWGPNAEAVVAMLRTVGFRQVQVIPGASRTRRTRRSLTQTLRRLLRPRLGIRPQRMVFHAWR
jgi:tRNA (mo5U34)-methyltransferase